MHLLRTRDEQREGQRGGHRGCGDRCPGVQRADRGGVERDSGCGTIGIDPGDESVRSIGDECDRCAAAAGSRHRPGVGDERCEGRDAGACNARKDRGRAADAAMHAASKVRIAAATSVSINVVPRSCGRIHRDHSRGSAPALCQPVATGAPGGSAET